MPMEAVMKAPTRLHVLRKARGLTQTVLAAMAGVSPSQVCTAEKGYASPAALAKLAAVLGEPDPSKLLEPPSADAPTAPDDERVLDRLAGAREALANAEE